MYGDLSEFFLAIKLQPRHFVLELIETDLTIERYTDAVNHSYVVINLTSLLFLPKPT